MIKERICEDIGNLTVDQFQTECESLGIEGAVKEIDSIIEQLIEVKLESGRYE
tara:strand:- start:97 stop:255 length:159 start_codon:yes stop_codon:yes gene_type:complete